MTWLDPVLGEVHASCLLKNNIQIYNPYSTNKCTVSRIILILLTSSQQNLYDVYLFLCVQRWTHDGQRDCPKHVEFHSINEFEKLVHLIGFVIRIKKKTLPVCGVNMMKV